MSNRIEFNIYLAKYATLENLREIESRPIFTMIPTNRMTRNKFSRIVELSCAKGIRLYEDIIYINVIENIRFNVMTRFSSHEEISQPWHRSIVARQEQFWCSCTSSRPINIAVSLIGRIKLRYTIMFKYSYLQDIRLVIKKDIFVLYINKNSTNST